MSRPVEIAEPRSYQAREMTHEPRGPILAAPASMRRLVVAIVIVATTTSAVAEPAPPPRKSPRTALWMSLGTTLGGLALASWGADIGFRKGECCPAPYANTPRAVEYGLAGVGGAALLVGPSLGSLYVDRFWNAGSYLRLAGVGTVGLGLAGALAVSERKCPTGVTDCESGGILVFGAGLVLGGGLYVAGAAYEIATTPRAARRYNRDHGLDATLTMTALRAQNGSLAPGFAVAGRF